VVTETDLVLSDGRTLHLYDAPPEAGATRLTVFWHHGTPNVGTPPEPLFPASTRRGPLGVLRPARLRRIDGAARPERGVGGR
jgi:hypothetical protein